MDTVAKRFEEAGLPYEITDTPITFVLSGAKHGDVAVVGCYTRGDVAREFAGFHHTTEAGMRARNARSIRGCYAAYTVNANEKD